MVMTILEATVEPGSWAALRAAYEEGIRDLSPGIVQTFLIQSQKDPTTWRIMTIWESQAALEAMRASGETPRGILMFRAANAQPVLEILAVQAQASRGVGHGGF